MISSLILLFLLIILNGFFAGSEIAFLLVDERKLKTKREEGDKRSNLILKLKKTPNKYLSTIQIGVSIASIFSGVFASEAFASFLTDWILTFANLSAAAVKTFSMLFITIIISYLILLFGELVPKRMAMSNPQRFAYIAVYPLSVLSKITTPIVKLLSISTNFFLKLIRIDPHKADEIVTEEEIRIMVREGMIDYSEKEMIESIFEFDDTKISDIMTHRTKIIAISSDASFQEILDIVNEERFTRYPVYKDTIDNIIGVLHSRELLRYTELEAKEEFLISDVIRKPYFIPDSKRADQLFGELQSHNTHMAIVIDEHGGTAGIVTMENLIEEIMGEILDEYDDYDGRSEILLLEDGEYLAQGDCDLEKLEDTLKIGLPVEEYDTVSGFIVGNLGRIPTNREVINKSLDFVFNGYLFSITDIEGKVISEVKIKKEEEREINLE